MLMSNTMLQHYGVKGMKWGVRRYQNKDGTLTELGKNREKSKEVRDIISTMSQKDRKLLNISDTSKSSKSDDEEQLVKRFILKSGGIPVSFFDITGDRHGVSVSLGTRSGSQYRQKGYGKKVAIKGKKWIDEHIDEYEQIVWWARKENVGSIKIAEQLGFQLDESSVLPDDPWIKYDYKKR